MSYESYLANAWEKYSAECEYHEGQNKYGCTECEELRDQYENEMYDRWKEDRMLSE
jgi:hypothetical protein